MPLHLLSKKSWNIYNPAAQERIAKDEAAAAAKEAEQDRRMQEYDSERRLAILRGDSPPPELQPERPQRLQKRGREDGSGMGDYRKRRRLQGEDDTDRDLRLAREDMEKTENARTTLGGTEQAGLKERKRIDTPIIDHAGHINLFPVETRIDRRAEKNAEVEAEKKRKERVLEDQYTMRFANAAGKEGVLSGTDLWYADSSRTSKIDSSAAYRGTTRRDRSSHDAKKLEDEKIEAELYNLGKDAWGRPDPARGQRDAVRVQSNDPLAFMKRAQSQFVKAKGDREVWEERRRREMEMDKDERRRRRRKEREKEEKAERSERRRRRESDESLEDFALDAPAMVNRSDRNRDYRPSSRERHRFRRDGHRDSKNDRTGEARTSRRRDGEERR